MELPEGWHLDPYKLHTDRWISNGRPTKLVRDDGVESYDAPPDEPFEGPLIPSAQKEPAPGDVRPEDGEYDPSKGLWEQGLGMYSFYNDAGKRAGES
jgi:hypothetical protein